MPELSELKKQTILPSVTRGTSGINVFSTIDPEDYSGQLSGPLYGTKKSLDVQRSSAQTNWESGANWLVRGLGKAVLSIPETTGHILDVKGWVGANDDYDNLLSKWAREQKEGLDQAFPEYSKDTVNGADKFNPLSFGWWMRNGDSTLESLGYFVPGMLLGKGVGLALKMGEEAAMAARIAKSLNKFSLLTTSERVAEAGGVLTAAIASNHAEGMQIAAQTYKDVYSQLAPSVGEQKAKELASEAAGKVSRANYAMLLPEIFEMKLMFKSFDSIRRGASLTKGWAARNLPELFKQMGLEGGEEGYQGIIQSEATRQAQIDAGLIEDDKSSRYSRVMDYLGSDQGKTEMFLGAIGGLGFGVAGGAMNMKKTARDRRRGKEAIALNEKVVSSIMKKQGELFDAIGKAVDMNNPTAVENAIRGLFINRAWLAASTGTFDQLEDFIDSINQADSHELEKNGWDSATIVKRVPEFKKMMSQVEDVYNQIHSLTGDMSEEMMTKLGNHLLGQMTAYEGANQAREDIMKAYAEMKRSDILSNNTHSLVLEQKMLETYYEGYKNPEWRKANKVPYDPSTDLYIFDRLEDIKNELEKTGKNRKTLETENLSDDILNAKIGKILNEKISNEVKYEREKSNFNFYSKKENREAWELENKKVEEGTPEVAPVKKETKKEEETIDSIIQEREKKSNEAQAAFEASGGKITVEEHNAKIAKIHADAQVKLNKLKDVKNDPDLADKKVDVNNKQKQVTQDFKDSGNIVHEQVSKVFEKFDKKANVGTLQHKGNALVAEIKDSVIQRVTVFKTQDGKLGYSIALKGNKVVNFDNEAKFYQEIERLLDEDVKEAKKDPKPLDSSKSITKTPLNPELLETLPNGSMLQVNLAGENIIRLKKINDKFVLGSILYGDTGLEFHDEGGLSGSTKTDYLILTATLNEGNIADQFKDSIFVLSNAKANAPQNTQGEVFEEDMPLGKGERGSDIEISEDFAKEWKKFEQAKSTGVIPSYKFESDIPNPDFDEGVSTTSLTVNKDHQIVPNTLAEEYDIQFAYSAESNTDTSLHLEIDNSFKPESSFELHDAPIVLVSHKRRDSKEGNGRVGHLPTLIKRPDGSYDLRQTTNSQKDTYQNLEELYNRKAAAEKITSDYERNKRLTSINDAIDKVRGKIQTYLNLRKAVLGKDTISAEERKNVIPVPVINFNKTSGMIQSNPGVYVPAVDVFEANDAFGLGLSHTLAISHTNTKLGWGLNEEGQMINDIESLGVSSATIEDIGSVYLISQVDARGGYIPIKLVKSTMKDLSEEDQNRVLSTVLSLIEEYRDTAKLSPVEATTKAKEIEGKLQQLFMTVRSGVEDRHGNFVLDSKLYYDTKNPANGANGSYFAIRTTFDPNDKDSIVEHRFYYRAKYADGYANIKPNANGEPDFTYQKYVNGKLVDTKYNTTKESVRTALMMIPFNVSTNLVNTVKDYSPIVDFGDGAVDYNTYVLKHFLKSNNVYIKEGDNNFKVNGHSMMFGNPSYKIALEAGKAKVDTTQKEFTPKITKEQAIKEGRKIKIPEIFEKKLSIINEPPVTNDVNKGNDLSGVDNIISTYLSDIPANELSIFEGVEDKAAALRDAFANYPNVQGRIKNVVRRLKTRLNSIAVNPTGISVDKTAAKQWWDNRLGVKLEVVHGLIDNGVGQSWGMFKDSMGYLSDEAPEGIERHEAFHVVMHMYLTPSQRSKIYDEARTKFGNPGKTEIAKFRAENADSKNYTDSEIANFILEERMADQFIEESQGKETSQPSLIRRMFNAIADFIRHMLGNPAYMERLYKNIAGGKFNYKPLYNSNIALNSIKRPVHPNFSPSQESTIVNSLTGMLLKISIEHPDYRIYLNPDLAPSLEGEMRKQIQDRIDNAKDDVVTVYADGATSQRDNWKRVLETFSPQSKQRDEYPGLYEKVLANLRANYNFKVSKGKVSFSDYQDISKEWDASFLKYNPKDKVDSLIKAEFLTMVDQNINPLLGIPMYINFNKIYPAVLRRLANKPTLAEKIHEMKKLASLFENELNKDEAFSKIIARLEDTSDVQFRSKFYQSFNTYSHDQMLTHFERTENGMSARNELVTSKDFRKELIDMWKTNYNSNLEQTLLKNKNYNPAEVASYNKSKKAEYTKLVNTTFSLLKRADTEDQISKALDPLITVMEDMGITLGRPDLVKSAIMFYLEDPDNLQLAMTLANTTNKVIAMRTILTNYQFGLNENTFTSNKGILAIMEKGLSPYSGDTVGWFNNLADIMSPFFLEEYDNITQTIDGEKQWVINTPNQLAMLMNKLNSKTESAQILDDFSYLTEGNWLPKMMKDGAPDFNEIAKFKYAMHQGVKLGDEGVAYERLNDIHRTLSSVSLFLDSYMRGSKDHTRFWVNMPYEADKTRHYILNVPKFVSTFNENGYMSSRDNPSFMALFKAVKQERDIIISLREKLAEVIELPTNEDGSLNFDAELNVSKLTAKQRTDYLIEPLLVRRKGDKYFLGNGLKFQFMKGMNEFSQLDLFNDSNIRSVLNKYITESYQEFEQKLLEEGFIYKENGILKSDHLSDEVMIQSYNRDISRMLMDFHVNYTIAQREIMYLLTGLDGEYKDIFDQGKRMAQYGAPYQSLYTEYINKQYGNLVIQDVKLSIPEKDWKTIAKRMDITVEQAKKDFAFLDGIETNDAQGWCTINRYKEILMGSARYPWAQERLDILERIEQGKADFKDWKTFMLQPIKGFYYKRIFDKNLGKHRSVQIKYALHPLTTQFTSGLQLDELRLKVEELEKESGANIEIIPESAFKVGRQGVVKVHDEEGNLSLPKLSKDNLVMLDNDGWGIQQDVPAHELDYDQKLGVQIAKLVLSNLGMENLYNFRGEQITGRELLNRFSDAVVENLEEDLQDAIDELVSDESIREKLVEEIRSSDKPYNLEGLLETRNGKFLLSLAFNISTKEFQPFLKSIFNKVRDLTMPGLPMIQVSDAFMRGIKVQTGQEGIKWLKGHDKTLKMHMENGTIYAEAVVPAWTEKFFVDGVLDIDKIQAEAPGALELIGYRIPTSSKSYSMVLKVVGFSNKTVSGDSIIVPYQLMKHMGFDFDVDKMFTIQRRVGYDEGKFFVYDSPHPETGNTRYMRDNTIFDVMQTIIQSPHHFSEVVASGEFNRLKEAAKAYSLSDVIPDGNTLAGQRILNERNMMAVIMKGVFANANGFIPVAQIINLRSMLPLRIKGSKKGNFQGYKGDFENIGKGTPQGDGKDKAMRKIANTSITEIFNRNKESSSYTTEKQLPWDSNKSINGVVMLARNKELSGQQLDLETIKRINEAYERNAEFIVGDMPGVDSQFINYLQKIGAKFTIYHTGKESRINIDNNIPLELNQFGKIGDSFKNLDGEDITALCGEFVNAIMDAAKEPTTSLININMYTANVAFAMVSMGLNFKDVAAFMQQPVLRQASKIDSSTDGYFIYRRPGFSPIGEARNMIMELFNLNETNFDGLNNVLSQAANIKSKKEGNFTEPFKYDPEENYELDFNQLNKYWNRDFLPKIKDYKTAVDWLADNYDFIVTQLKSVNSFKNINAIGQNYVIANSVLASDRKNDSGFNSIHRMVDNRQRLIDNELLTSESTDGQILPGVEAIFSEESPYKIGQAYWNIDMESINSLTSSSRFFLHSREYHKAYLEFKKELGVNLLGQEDDEQMFNKFTNAVMAYINSQNPILNKEVNVNYYLSDEYIKKFSRQREAAIKNGFTVMEKFIINQEPIDKARNAGIPLITFDSEKMTSVLKDEYSAQLADLFYGNIPESATEQEEDLIAELGNDLLYYQFATTGFIPTKGSAAQVTPYELWLDPAFNIAPNIEAHAKMHPYSIVNSDFVKMFVQHNAGNRRIVYDVSYDLSLNLGTRLTKGKKNIPDGLVLTSTAKKLIAKDSSGRLKVKKYISHRFKTTVFGQEVNNMNLYKFVGVQNNMGIWVRIDTRGIPNKAYEYFGETTSMPSNKVELSEDQIVNLIPKEYKDFKPMNGVNMDEETVEDVKEENMKPSVKGINISSRSDDSLGRALTNPIWGSKKDGKSYYDVETLYKANASKIKAPKLNMEEALKYDMNLMYTLQVEKFRKNPELIDEINKRGGLAFIESSSHIVGVKGSRWEGEGMNSNFIKVLAKSYETVAKELNKFVESNTITNTTWTSNSEKLVAKDKTMTEEVWNKMSEQEKIEHLRCL